MLLSIFLITCNEEKRLARTLEAASALAEDIVLVDSGSQDKTLEIASTYGARVFDRVWEGYGPQKRFAEDQCHHDWVLNLDADEVLTPDLIQEIKTLFEQGPPPYKFYRLRLVSVYPHQDRPRPFADFQNCVRLYNRRFGRYADHPTWDRVVLPPNTPSGQLKNKACHYSILDLHHFIDKENRYTSLQAQTQKTKAPFLLILRLCLEFPFSFLKTYLLRRHIFGGMYGFCLSVSHAHARFSRIAKMWEHHVFKEKAGAFPELKQTPSPDKTK